MSDRRLTFSKLLVLMNHFLDQKSDFDIEKLLPNSYFWKWNLSSKNRKKAKTKSWMINLYLTYILYNVNKYKYRYFSKLIFSWKKHQAKSVEKMIYKTFEIKYQTKLQSIGVSNEILKRFFDQHFHKPCFDLRELQVQYYDYCVRFTKLKNINIKCEEIATLLKSDSITRAQHNIYIDELATLNRQHQKVFYSHKHKNMITRFQKQIKVLDDFIMAKENVFAQDEDDYGYLNTYLNNIKFNFTIFNNVYKILVVDSLKLLKDIDKFMYRYGFKTTHETKPSVTIENSTYIFNAVEIKIDPVETKNSDPIDTTNDLED